MDRKILPEGFVEELKMLLGAEEGAELAEMLAATDSPVSIRMNPRKKIHRAVYDGMTPLPWNRNGFYLAERPSFTLDPLFHAGAFYVQEASSMIYGWIIEQLGFDEPICAVDLCAAPGGKAGAVLNELPAGSVMVANEFVAQRSQILRENMAKQGAPDVIVTNSPIEAIRLLGSTFDLMIADVPCSGEGMMRKEEVARTQWSDGLIRQCRKLQREILREALPALKPGGYLIYSTCTFNRAENEENIRWLIEEYGLENIKTSVPERWNISPGLDTDISALRFFPHKTTGEGLFVSILRNPVDAEVHSSAPARPAKHKKGATGQKGPEPGLKDLKNWIDKKLCELSIDERGEIRAMSPATAELAGKLRAAGVRILSAGVDIAYLKGRDFVPAAPLALSTAFNTDAFPSTDLSLEEALEYLRHEAIRLPDNTPRGFVVVTYEGLPLGFVKNIGNRANNLYPIEWRIRNK